ncbi:MAG: hypothetical protein IPP14_15035 [Planctomycetes bacterium]|nr:hypothetical protein [Planctomycetota bacterium]
MTTLAPQISAANHQIASHRSLRVLTDWATEFTKEQQAAGHRVIFAPAHALGGCVSLRSWILDQASQSLGDSAPDEPSLLLSGAADVILIADPASADPASLHWLTDMLSVNEEVADLTVTPPLPQLVVLVPSRTNSEPAVASFLAKLGSLGSQDVRVIGKGSDAAVTSADVSSLLGRNDELLAALALSPAPLVLEDLNSLVRASGKSTIQVSELISGPLFQMAGELVTPTSADATAMLRQKLPADALRAGAALLLPIIEARYETLPDARVELSLRSGDAKRAGKLARRRMEEHLAADRNEEALRLMELLQVLGLSIETGKHAHEVDKARLAWLYASTGAHEQAAALVKKLARRRECYDSPAFVEWLALAGRLLTLAGATDARQADSLLRRAIRMAGDNVDASVRLTLLRVSLLSSSVMNLEERSGWLLSHINNEMLEDVSPATLAQYYEDTANRLWNRQDIRGAIRRLRKLIVRPIPDAQMARGLLLLARCRTHVQDADAARRFAESALHHAIRATDLATVRASAEFLRQANSRRPRDLPRLSAPARGPKARPRIPAVADIQAPPAPEPAQVFEILQARFGVTHWTRRRGSRTESFGQPGVHQAVVSVFEESEGGWRKLATGGEPGRGESTSALILMRSDGSDLVTVVGGPEADARQDALVRFLLADRATAAATGEPPRRRVVLDDYYRRALDHGTETGLHTTMEMLFNKDVLLYFEEQGIGKEEMAEKLNVSRATLYRMYARSALNI